MVILDILKYRGKKFKKSIKKFNTCRNFFLHILFVPLYFNSLCLYTVKIFISLCLCTTAYATIAYHHWCEYEPRSGRCVQHYVIKIIQKITLIYKQIISFSFVEIKIQRYEKSWIVLENKENFTNPNSWTMTQKKMKCIDLNYE
jgi:hypothetical protein